MRCGVQCGVRVRFRCSRDDATLSQRPLLSGTPTAVHANSFPSGRVLWDTVSGMYRMHTISTDAHWAGLHYTSARAGMHCQQTAQPLILSTRSRHSREDAIHAANFFFSIRPRPRIAAQWLLCLDGRRRARSPPSQVPQEGGVAPARPWAVWRTLETLEQTRNSQAPRCEHDGRSTTAGLRAKTKITNSTLEFRPGPGRI